MIFYLKITEDKKLFFDLLFGRCTCKTHSPKSKKGLKIEKIMGLSKNFTGIFDMEILKIFRKS